MWEFDPSLGTPEEIEEVEKIREAFRESRFEKKHSCDLLMRLQVRGRGQNIKGPKADGFLINPNGGASTFGDRFYNFHNIFIFNFLK